MFMKISHNRLKNHRNVAKMLCGTPKTRHLSAFLSHFSKINFEKRLIRQSQRLALSVHAVLRGTSRGWPNARRGSPTPAEYRPKVSKSAETRPVVDVRAWVKDHAPAEKQRCKIPERGFISRGSWFCFQSTCRVGASLIPISSL